MVVYDVLTFLQTMAFVCSTCGKAYSPTQNLARHSETHQDPKACHCGEVFSTSEGLKENKRAKHEFRYSCTECSNPVIFARKPGHTKKYHSRKPTSSTTFCSHRKTAKRRHLKVSFFLFLSSFL